MYNFIVALVPLVVKKRRLKASGKILCFDKNSELREVGHVLQTCTWVDSSPQDHWRGRGHDDNKLRQESTGFKIFGLPSNGCIGANDVVEGSDQLRDTLKLLPFFKKIPNQSIKINSKTNTKGLSLHEQTKIKHLSNHIIKPLKHHPKDTS